MLSDSDVGARLDALEEAERVRFDPHRLRASGIDARTAREVARVAEQWQRKGEPLTALLGGAQAPTSAAEAERRLARALFAGFPDRVAKRRSPSAELVLSTGVRATLAPESGVQQAALLLAVAADSPRGQQRTAVVRQAVRIEADWLFDWAGERIETREELSYDAERDQVDALSVLAYGKVVLDESRTKALPGRAAGQVLLRAATAKGAALYDPEGRLESLAVRLGLLREHLPELLTDLPPAAAELLATTSNPSAFAAAALTPASELVTSLRELRELDLPGILLASLPSPLPAALDRELPETWRLPGGRELRIVYSHGRPPLAESRLQDFFSVTRAPLLCRGRLPLQIHLLAPNKRAVQVTTDLASFWKTHYPELRGQLMRRYPKHAWPADGATASPPPPGKLR